MFISIPYPEKLPKCGWRSIPLWLLLRPWPLRFRVYNSQTVQFSTTLAFKPSQGLFSTTSKMRGSGKTFPTGAFIIGCMHPLSSEQSHLKGKTKCFPAFRSHIQSAAHFKKAIPMHVALWICSTTFNPLSVFYRIQVYLGSDLWVASVSN